MTAVADALGAAADRWQIVLIVVEQDGSLVLVAEPTARRCHVLGVVS